MAKESYKPKPIRPYKPYTVGDYLDELSVTVERFCSYVIDICVIVFVAAVGYMLLSSSGG